MNSDILKQQKDYYGTYLKIKDNPRYKKIWNFIKKNDLEGKLLDIGCSNGDFSAPLIKEGFDCYGLEFMDGAVKESEEKGIKVTKGSFIEKFSFEDSFFDIIFAGEVIEHTVEDMDFLVEVNRVLKSGGLLILTTPNLVSLGNRLLMLLGFMPRFAYAEFHYKIYNRNLLVKKIESSGFRVENFSSNYILISTFFNKPLGIIGEFFGDLIPSFGENFIVYARKMSKTADNQKYYVKNKEYPDILEGQKPTSFTKYINWVNKLGQEGTKFLDVGCGTGIALTLLDDKVSGSGVDISETSIAFCAEKGLDCKLYDGYKLPFSDSSFNTIGSINVLEHTNDPDHFLNEQLRVLSNGGYLILACPNFLSITDNFHWHTSGLRQKAHNLVSLVQKFFSRNCNFEKMQTIEREEFWPDDDACNVTNPIDILKWSKENSLRIEYWSSQSAYKDGRFINFIDKTVFKIFFGSCFFVFRKN